MNILFLGLPTIQSFSDQGIYTDLLREITKRGHNVFCVTSVERRFKTKTTHIKENAYSHILVVKTLNIQKTNLFEKGLGTVLITSQYKRAIKKFFKNIHFDLILYSTPPITLYGVVNYFKKRCNSKTYLMLKDIFPQNAVDIGLLSKKGVKGLIFKRFRNQERKLYAISDKIGCMSPANIEYILRHNSEISKNKVEVFPNCIETKDVSFTDNEKKQIRIKYGIPLDKKVFVYGGNLGRPQGVSFIIECLKTQTNNDNAFFLVVGDGTQYEKLEKYSVESNQPNFRLLKRLPAAEFDKVVASCDVGLIFLDYRFTIPNFPSRLLSYLQNYLPVLACTDPVSDVGKTAEKYGFGWACESNNPRVFSELVERILQEDTSKMGKRGHQFLKEQFDVSAVVHKIL